jgi:hypothetical protein
MTRRRKILVATLVLGLAASAVSAVVGKLCQPI